MDTTTKTSLLSTLKDGVVAVTFTKVDGTERVMQATLDPTITPAEAIAPTGGIITVWDTEKTAWRAFREDSVISYAAV